MKAYFSLATEVAGIAVNVTSGATALPQLAVAATAAPDIPLLAKAPMAALVAAGIGWDSWRMYKRTTQVVYDFSIFFV